MDVGSSGLPQSQTCDGTNGLFEWSLWQLEGEDSIRIWDLRSGLEIVLVEYIYSNMSVFFSVSVVARKYSDLMVGKAAGRWSKPSLQYGWHNNADTSSLARLRQDSVSLAVDWMAEPVSHSLNKHRLWRMEGSVSCIGPGWQKNKSCRIRKLISHPDATYRKRGWSRLVIEDGGNAHKNWKSWKSERTNRRWVG